MDKKDDTKYDAFLLVSFGGPEGMDDVLPFLENVLRGKNVPRERMLAVGKHYELFNGVSPINEANRQLIKALSPVIEASGPKLPIYWGNRNWHPLLPDTIKKMAADGVRRAVAFVTSAYSSYSSCRQYIENIEDARASVGGEAPVIDKIDPFYNNALFIEANAEELLAALNTSKLEKKSEVPVVFTAHSIPLSMAQACRYENQLLEVCAAVMKEAKLNNPWKLVYQSRSGPPSQAWLEPDVNDHIEVLSKAGAKEVLVVPVGFVFDHMEILFDLDTQAKATCEKLSVGYLRAKAAGHNAKFIQMIKELVEEKLSCTQQSFSNEECDRPKTDADFCYPGCCPKG